MTHCVILSALMKNFKLITPSYSSVMCAALTLSASVSTGPVAADEIDDLINSFWNRRVRVAPAPAPSAPPVATPVDPAPAPSNPEANNLNTEQDPAFDQPSSVIRAQPVLAEEDENTPVVIVRTNPTIKQYLNKVQGLESIETIKHRDANALLVAIEEDSPASFVERVQLAAMAMHASKVQANEATIFRNNIPSDTSVVFSANDFCPIYRTTTSQERIAYRSQDREIALQLMRGYRARNGAPTAPCGQGLLRAVKVIPANFSKDHFRVILELNGDLNVRSDMGTLLSQGQQLAYKSSLNADSDMIIKRVEEIKGSQILDNKLTESFKKTALGFDVQEGLAALIDARQNEPEPDVQARRVLSNYSIYSFSPETPNTGIGLGRVSSGLFGRSNIRMERFAGTEFLMHAPALSATDEGIGHRKAVLSIRPIVTYENFRTVDIEVEFGESRLLPAITVNPEWQQVVDGALKSISEEIEAHVNGLATTGIGSMYGPKSYYAKLESDEARLEYIEKRKKPGTQPPLPKLTSCIGFVQNQLRAGYLSAGKRDRILEIDRYVGHKDGQGGYLLQQLQEDGWKLIYWAPDARNPTERLKNRSKESDHHRWTFGMVNAGKGYLTGSKSTLKRTNGPDELDIFPGLKVDYLAVNYRPTNPTLDPEEAALWDKWVPEEQRHDIKVLRNLKADEFLQSLPFFVGIANGGYHVYLGSKGMIIESHSTRGPTDQTNIELRPFNQFGLFEKESYLTGVIAVPPGPWMDGLTDRMIK